MICQNHVSFFKAQVFKLHNTSIHILNHSSLFLDTFKDDLTMYSTQGKQVQWNYSELDTKTNWHCCV